ncbi:MAG: DUF6242 domain-containing protein [Bacteroidota bacterium]|nr:DUF6242 domain-containing protein [Bacteroidota bacterium]
MRIYNTFRLLALVLMTGILASCWDNFEEQSFDSANVISFSFASQDTCDGIASYVFNIDQFKGEIYNVDSLPYGSKVDYLLPTISFQSSNGKVYINDTTLWSSSSDTLDFTNPLKLTNTSSDGTLTRKYIIHVNVHQVDPDSVLTNYMPSTLPAESPRNKVLDMGDTGFRCYFSSPVTGFIAYQSNPDVSVWTPQLVSGLSESMNIQSVCRFNSNFYACSESGKLYMSTDGLNWMQAGNANTFVTLYGSLNRKYLTDDNPCYLIGLVKTNSGEIHSAKSADAVNWVEGSSVDDDFPVADYGAFKETNVTNVQYYTVGTGLRADGAFSSSLWSTDDGLEWVQISSGEDLPIASVKGATLCSYDNKVVCFGGINANGKLVKTVSISKDRGKYWVNAPDDWVFPKVKAGLAYGSIVVRHIADLVNDKDREFMWFFGGRNQDGTAYSVWKAYEHKMLFIRR